MQREAAARRMEEAPESLTNADATPNRSGNWHESDSGIEWVACSADSTFTGGCHTEGGDGDSQSGQEEGETAVAEKSILEDEETFTTGWFIDHIRVGLNSAVNKIFLQTTFQFRRLFCVCVIVLCL